jgi:hypothetical protein
MNLHLTLFTQIAERDNIIYMRGKKEKKQNERKK